MAGYNGYSMSNNAVQAYEQGERPYSRWTKKAFFEEIEKMIAFGDLPETVREDLAGMKVDDLKAFLSRSSWHHTSAKYNKTDFYSISDKKILSRFGYHMAVSAMTPDGRKIGEWTDRNQETMQFMNFKTEDGNIYPSASTSDRYIIYIKK